MVEESKKTTGGLKEYNERLFAVFGTLGAVLFLSLLAMLAYSEVIKPFLRSPYEPTDVMISDAETQEALAQGLRLQAASYEEARRLFDDFPYYVIPVGQRTLKEPEMIAFFGAADDYRQARRWRQDTNNLVVWNRESGATEIVLPERRSIGSWNAYLEDGIPYLLVVSEKIDTTVDIEDQPDNAIWTTDLALWVYALESGALTKIELPGKSGIRIDMLDESRLAFVHMGDYEEGSGVFDGEREPMSLYRVDAAAGKLIPAIPDSIRVQVQNILDGGSQEEE